MWQLNGALIKPVLALQKERLPIVFNLGDYWLKDLKTETDLEPNILKKRFRLFLLGIKDFRRIDLRYLLTNSLSLRQKYVEAGFKKENITVIPRGIPSSLILDHADLAKLNRAHNDKIKLVFVGRLVPDKAPDIAIRAVAHIVRQTDITNIHLDIIGSGDKEYSEVLQNIVASLKIKNNVHFLGQIEHDELLPRYQTYDCLLFTSRWEEPFSFVLLEAMASGVPVIATNSGSVTEVIADGINGIIVPKDQPIALANAIKKVVQENDFTQKIRLAALDTVRNNFALEVIIDKSEAYLQKVRQEFLLTSNS
jgi:glycosyltransferase involved in cell wall biosynthesis